MSQESAPDEEKTPRRRRNSARTQVDILRAAGDLFARRGYAHVTLKDIARHVGVTPALIVHYFESKRHLFGEVAQIPPTTALRDHSLDPKTVARDLMTFWREDDSRLAALALARSMDLDGGELFRQAIENRIFEPWSTALSAQGDDGVIRAHLLGSVLMGYGLFATNALWDPDAAQPSPDEDARVLIYLERILHACLTPPPADAAQD